MLRVTSVSCFAGVQPCLLGLLYSRWARGVARMIVPLFPFVVGVSSALAPARISR